MHLPETPGPALGLESLLHTDQNTVKYILNRRLNFISPYCAVSLWSFPTAWESWILVRFSLYWISATPDNWGFSVSLDSFKFLMSGYGLPLDKFSGLFELFIFPVFSTYWHIWKIVVGVLIASKVD